MTNPVIYAAAYILLTGQPVQSPLPEQPIPDTVMCQLPSPPAPVSGHMNSHHLAVVRGDPPPRHAMRGVRWHRHHHCFRVGRHWRCR